MGKPVTISVHVGTGSEGEQRLVEWKTAAAKAGLWHGDTPAVGKWLALLADREIERQKENKNANQS